MLEGDETHVPNDDEITIDENARPTMDPPPPGDYPTDRVPPPMHDDTPDWMRAALARMDDIAAEIAGASRAISDRDELTNAVQHLAAQVENQSRVYCANLDLVKVELKQLTSEVRTGFDSARGSQSRADERIEGLTARVDKLEQRVDKLDK